jgi:putative oxidoreductase
MVFVVATNVFILHASPVPAIVLGLLNTLVMYQGREELVDLLHWVKG